VLQRLCRRQVIIKKERLASLEKIRGVENNFWRTVRVYGKFHKVPVILRLHYIETNTHSRYP
jgi:hypothetical protein